MEVRMRVLYRFYGTAILTAQAVGCLAWWILMATVPAVRETFVFAGMPDHVFNGLFLPDALLYAGLAAAGALLLWRGSDLGFLFLIAHFGAAAYAVLMAAGLADASGGGMIGAVLMAVPTVAEGLLVWGFWKDFGRAPA
jgi:hypothetical protein